MMTQKTQLAAFVLITLPAQSQAVSVQVSPLEFVKSFYSWYVPIALKSHDGPASDIAIKQKGSLFSRELAQALREDSAAQAKAPGEIVGIDWDPFLSSQDPEDHYEIGKVTHKGGRFFVDVHGGKTGKKSTTPDIVAELVKKDSSWVFVNFHTPGKGDLLSSLKLLRKDRNKASNP